jgi:hypothetical protein
LRLLLVEDDDALAGALVEGLRGEDFAIDRFATLREARAAVAVLTSQSKPLR